MPFLPFIVCPTCDKPATVAEWVLTGFTRTCPHCGAEHDTARLETQLSDPTPEDR